MSKNCCNCVRSRIVLRGCCVIALALQAGSLAACGGHGKYTEEFRQDANTRMNQVRAGTEWDLAHTQFLAGDLKKALRSVDKSISITDQVARPHALKGRILFEMGENDKAIESFNSALAIDPTYAEAHYFVGIVYERLMQSQRALQSYKSAMQHDPTSPQYAIAAGEMYIQLNDLDSAERLLNDPERNYRHTAGVTQLLGHIALMRGDTRTGITLFQEACLLAPDEPSLLEDLARAQIAVGDFSEAEYSITRLLRMDREGKRRDLQHLRARCLMELDRPVEAREIFNSLTKDERGSSDFAAWMGIAQVSIVLKENLRLREAANRMMRMAPERHEGYLMLAIHQRSRGELESAIKLLDQAIERTRSDAQPAVLQAMIYHDLGRLSDAFKSAQTAQRLDPSSTQAQLLVSAIGSQIQNRAVADVPVGID